MNETQASQLPVYAGNDLGAVWRSSATAFRLWAPTACSAALHRFATGTDAEPEAADLGTLAMQRSEGGTWYLELAGDLAGQYYQYELQFPDGTSTVTADPYAHAAGAGGTRSMVLNQAAAVPDGWQKDERPAIPAHARSVWEVHVADFTADPASGVPQAYRGKFMGFTVDGTTLNGDGVHPTGLNYLKRLGVTHVQLQPIFDFATVDEVSGEDYNWGYDPLNYNLPEGSYATDAFHGEVRVRECRAMVQALHSAGLGVVMDVVYNHTYYSYSWLERTVPGYWNRRWENGSLTNGSGCGCDLASERPMVRKYVVESVLYWATAYHIDGFRFALSKMGISGALFDLDKLRDVSKNVVAAMPAQQVYDAVAEWAKEYDRPFYDLLTADPAYALRVLSIGRGGKKPRKDIALWSDVKPYMSLFYDELFTREEPMPQGFDASLVKKALSLFCETYDEHDTQEQWFAKVKAVASALGFAPEVKQYKQSPESYPGHVGDVSMFLRIALTGRSSSPDMYEIMQILGRERTLARLNGCPV